MSPTFPSPPHTYRCGLALITVLLRVFFVVFFRLSLGRLLLLLLFLELLLNLSRSALSLVQCFSISLEGLREADPILISLRGSGWKRDIREWVLCSGKMFDFLRRKDIRKILKRKDSDAGQKGNYLDILILSGPSLHRVFLCFFIY